MKKIIDLFDTRLDTLSHLLRRAGAHFGDDRFLASRLADDMLPLGTQIVFTCNQPRNFTQWVKGEEIRNLDPKLETLEAADTVVASTRSALSSIDPESVVLPPGRRLDFGPAGYAELSADEYVDDFLVPNFYFHLVTTYAILRANGVPLGKADYMAHLLGRLRPAS